MLCQSEDSTVLIVLPKSEGEQLANCDHMGSVFAIKFPYC